MDDSQNVPLKRCNRCKQEKPASKEFFPRDRSKKDGFATLCKVCKYSPRPTLPPVPEGYKRCTKCEQIKPATNDFFSAEPQGRGGLRSDCKQCVSARHAKYYQETIDQRRAYSAQFKAAHRERYREYNAQWNALHRSTYYQAHRDYYQNYWATHREQARAHYHSRRARKTGNGGTFTKSDIQRQFKAQKGRCYYCRKKVGRKYHIDHVIPLSRGGSSVPSNLVIACPTCNNRKYNRMLHEWPEGGRLI